MSKQRPTGDKLTNELLGASAFFRPASKANEVPKTAPSPAQQNDTSPAPTPSDVMTSRRQSVTTSQAPLDITAGFDINRPTASRDSLRLSPDETKALDALRSAFKWDFDLTVSKNDICRVALHALLEEFATKADRSQAVSRLKRKVSGR